MKDLPDWIATPLCRHPPLLGTSGYHAALSSVRVERLQPLLRAGVLFSHPLLPFQGPPASFPWGQVHHVTDPMQLDETSLPGAHAASFPPSCHLSLLHWHGETFVDLLLSNPQYIHSDALVPSSTPKNSTTYWFLVGNKGINNPYITQQYIITYIYI